MKKLLPIFIAIGVALFLVLCCKRRDCDLPVPPIPPTVNPKITPLGDNEKPIGRSHFALTDNQENSTTQGSAAISSTKESLETAIESSIQGSFDVDLLLDEALGALNFPLRGIDLDHWDQDVFAFSLQSPDKDFKATLVLSREKIEREGKLLRSYGLRLERSYENEKKYVDGILRRNARLDIQILVDENSRESRQLQIGVYFPVALGRANAMGTDLYHGEYVDSAIYALALDGASEPYAKLTGIRNGQPVQPNLFQGVNLVGQLWPSKDLLEVFAQRLQVLASQVQEKR